MLPRDTLKLLVRIATLISISLSTSLACRLSANGCTKDRCAALANLKAPPSRGNTFDKSIGCSYGVRNEAVEWTNDVELLKLMGGPFVNFGVYPEVETENLIHTPAAERVTTLSGCCSLCASTPGCQLYQFFTDGDPLAIPSIFRSPASEWPPGFNSGQQCYLLKGGSIRTGGGSHMPFSGTAEQQRKEFADFPPSWVGGMCSVSEEEVSQVPAARAPSSTSGGIGKTFCFISDDNIHMNVKLGGYTTVRALSGKSFRTWIKEIGLVWSTGAGTKHTLVLTARTGKQQRRGFLGRSFLGKVLLDGQEVSAPSRFRPVKSGLLLLSSLGSKKVNKVEVEMYSLIIDGVLDMTIRVRPAQRSLQTDEDSQIHFNVNVNYLAATPRVHGILGQSFRRSGSESVKALEYKMLSRLMSGPLTANGKSGAAFLEGLPSEYETSGILSTDAKFSAFE